MNSSDLNNHDKHFSSYKEGFSPDLEAGLSRLRGRIAAEAKPQAKIRRLSRRSVISAAAAVLLLISVGLLLFLGNGSTVVNNSTDEPMAYTLPDGTEVLLQQGTELSFGPEYNVTDRLIELEGQAYFEVTKNLDIPFLVTNSETELRVTGTAFNLRVQGEEMEVEVSEGTVELRRDGKIFPVEEKHCGLAVSGKACTVKTAKDLNRHAWRTGVLRFQNVPLSEVINTVSNNYGFRIDMPRGCDFPFSGTFSNEDPVSVLRTVAEHGQGELEILDQANNSYRLSVPDCQ